MKAAWLKLILPRSRPTFVCYFYRASDGNLSNALELLREENDNFVTKPDANVIYLDDMNVDLLKQNANAKKIKSVLKHLYLRQTVTKPSRATANTMNHYFTIYIAIILYYIHTKAYLILG